MGKESTPTNKTTPANLYYAYTDNGNITGDAMRQGLNARLGHERAERGNPYAMMSLFDMAQASLTHRGISTGSYGTRSQIVNAAFTHSSSDFTDILAGGAENQCLQAGSTAAKHSASGRKRFPFKLPGSPPRWSEWLLNVKQSAGRGRI